MFLNGIHRDTHLFLRSESRVQCVLILRDTLRSISALSFWPCFPFSGRRSKPVSSHDPIAEGGVIGTRNFKPSTHTQKIIKEEEVVQPSASVACLWAFSSFLSIFVPASFIYASLYSWGCAFKLMHWQHRDFRSMPFAPIDRQTVRLLRGFCVSFM